MFEELKAWGGVKRFQKPLAKRRKIVFYAEDHGSWPHLGPIVEELLRRGRPVTYLTGQADDPILERDDPGLEAFFVGVGPARTWLFLKLDCTVMVMTMPDLDTYHVKRSRLHDVHYAYVFHSMASCHTIYRPHALDHYDSILCVGPYHMHEIRAMEQMWNTPAKRLFEHGYGRLDALLTEPTTTPEPDPIHVLIATSWGEHELLGTAGAELVTALLREGYRVTVRPHPRVDARVLQRLHDLFGEDDHYHLDQDIASAASLQTAHVMISDWSGAALEFAFGFRRPVLFVDTPQKINNPEWEKTGLPAFEREIRDIVGGVLPENQVAHAGAAVRSLLEREDLGARIDAARDRTIFNVGESHSAGADAIEMILASIENSASGYS